jgi:integrin beta 1
LTQDYPTLQQINKAIVNHQINVIFSVPKSAFRVYEELSQNLVGAVTGELAEDSKNIVELISENYKVSGENDRTVALLFVILMRLTSDIQKIVFTIELKDTSSPNIDLKYFTKCLQSDGKLVESNVCNKVGAGQQVVFELSVAMKSCEHYLKNKSSSDTKFKEKFVVFAVGIEQYVEIELELMCQCDCEREKAIDKLSAHCNKNGNRSFT